jgi:transposase
MSLSSQQKGKIVESQIANLLILLSKGTLTPNLPIVDDYGIDIVLGRKGSVDSLFIQVKSRFKTSSRQQNRLDFQIEKQKMVIDQKAFLLCVYFDQTIDSIKTMWLIPSSEVKSNAIRLKKYYRIACSYSDASEDKWAKYKVDAEALVRKLIGLLTNR